MNQCDHAAILLVDTNAEERDRTQKILQEAGFGIRTADNFTDALESTFDEPPQGLLIAIRPNDPDPFPFLSEWKSDNIYGRLPLVLLLENSDLVPHVSWAEVPADDFLTYPVGKDELIARLKLSIARNLRAINANPLTGLPGNPSIMDEVERRLRAGKPFTFAYFDIDNFKAYNDRYGFSRGDEVLRMTARLIVNAVRSLGSRETYVGHVGGDDFVFMVPSQLIKKTCERILRDFDEIVPGFYDEADRKQGVIHAVNRTGDEQEFPLITCSVAVVDTQFTAIKHIGDLFTRVTEIKAFTKRLPGSNFLVDRRKM